MAFGYRDYDFLPSGDALIVTVSAEAQAEAGEARRIQVVTDWFELVEERAPAR